MKQSRKRNLGRGWFKYNFSSSWFQTSFSAKKQTTLSANMSFLSTEDLLTASVSFDYRLFNHSQLNGSYPPRLTFELGFMAVHLVHPELAAFPQSEVVCDCDYATQGLSSHSLTPPQAAHSPLADRLMHIANTKRKELHEISSKSDQESGVWQSTWKQRYSDTVSTFREEKWMYMNRKYLYINLFSVFQ